MAAVEPVDPPCVLVIDRYSSMLQADPANPAKTYVIPLPVKQVYARALAALRPGSTMFFATVGKPGIERSIVEVSLMIECKVSRCAQMPVSDFYEDGSNCNMSQQQQQQ
jgi:hypothetical protein